MAAPAATTVALLLLVPLVAWRVYSRVRRMVGRQRLSKWRARITLIVFPLVSLLLASSAIAHPERLALFAVALAAGAALSMYGLKKTEFEPTPGMIYYTPNAHLGIALSLLFLARIAWRVFEVWHLPPGTANGQEFARSPLTLGVFGLLAGYYMGYAIGLLHYRRGVLRRKADREALEKQAAAPEP